MSLINRNNKPASTNMNVKNAEEIYSMNNVNPTSDFNSIFENRRQFVPQGWDTRLSLSEDQIRTMSCRNSVLRLFGENRIRITQNANGTRKDATVVLFGNGPQYDQIARALAIYENIPMMGQAMVDTQGYKQIALLDTKGNHDVIIYEKEGAEGWINYSVFYSQKQYNQHGQVIGLVETSEDPIQDWIRQWVQDGYKGFDGIERESHNQWVDRYNSSVLAYANNEATDEQLAMLKNVKTEADPNKFVQINSKRHINWLSIANKYAILSWLVLDATRPAFELYNRAKTAESNQKFIEGAIAIMERGYRNQLRSLSGLYKTVSE